MARFRFGEHLLDSERRELRRADKLVDVEPQVFDLLLYLIRSRERVVSKDDLIEAVWDGRVVSDATLNSRIKAARQAIGDDGVVQALIRTFPRKGVRFVVAVQEDNGSALSATSPNAAAPALVLPLPDKPSIAVLPFLNMSGDPDQEYFADGMTEDIITALSKWRWFFVIARNSSFSYRGHNIEITQVGRELGVQYVLEGSIRKAADRVRVTAQLIDARNGMHVWADRFDQSLGDIFAMQDDITRGIAAAVEPALARSEAQYAVNKPTDNMAAWDCYLRGMWHFNQLSDKARHEALACFQHALALDGELAEAHIGASRALHAGAVYVHNDQGERERILARALAAARRALELDDENAYGWFAFAIVSATKGECETAVEAATSAVELNPNLAWGHFALAVARLYHGEPEQALTAADTALRLNPKDPQRFAWLAPRASALYLLQRYDAAIETALEAQELRKIRGLPGFRTASRILAASYAQLGLTEPAGAAVAEMLEGGGELTIADVIRPFRRDADREHYAEGLRKAGLPAA